MLWHGNGIDSWDPSLWKTGACLSSTFNSCCPGAAYMRRWTWSASVQIMACRPDGAKPLSEPMLKYCQLEHKEQISMKLYLKLKYFHSRKCVGSSKSKSMIGVVHTPMLSLYHVRHILIFFIIVPYFISGILLTDNETDTGKEQSNQRWLSRTFAIGGKIQDRH